MSWRLRWIVVAPVVLFVAFTVLMSSCGGGGSDCTGSFDQFGNFQAGVCPSPAPGPGFAIQTIVIGAGAPPVQTPTPGPTATKTPIGRTPTPAATPVSIPTLPLPPTSTPSPTTTFKVRTPTPTPTLIPQAGSTTAMAGDQVFFQAEGFFKKGSRQALIDITNSSSTLWTSSNTTSLAPPQPPPNGGIYQALQQGCSCIDASSGGTSAAPVSVGVFPVGGAPSPCPVCPTFAATPTSTPKGHGVVTTDVEREPTDTARISGVLQWTLQTASPIISPLRASSDGNLYFLTLDGNLHALDAKGHERWSRGASGTSIAVSPDGTVYALGADGSLEALSPIGKPLWNIKVASAVGPLAASSSAVYFQEDRQLFAATSSGATQWRAGVADEITSAAITDDGGIIAATLGASVTAINSDGSRRWRFAPTGGFAGEIAVRGNLVYLGSGSGRLYAIDASTGSQQWTYDSSAAIGAGPVLNTAGPIFFGSDAIYALNSDGSLSWSKALAKAASSPMASDGEGGVMAPLDDDINAMLNSDGSVKWATRSFGPVERAIVSPSGVLYVARQGTIYAVK